MFHIVGRELFPVWTYVTNGLSTHKQKEIVFVLKCLPDERSEEFPNAPLSLFKIIFDYAKQGVIVDEGPEFSFTHNHNHTQLFIQAHQSHSLTCSVFFIVYWLQIELLVNLNLLLLLLLLQEK
jgi:hypothetical protein